MLMAAILTRAGATRYVHIIDAGAVSRAARTGTGEPDRSALDRSAMGVMALRKRDCAGFESPDRTANS